MLEYDISEKTADELRDLLYTAENDAIINKIPTQIWYDTNTKEVWDTHNVSNETYTDEGNIKLIADINPFTLEEIYGDDPKLKEDPDGFLNWYLYSGDAFDPDDIIDQFCMWGEPVKR